MHWSGTNIFTTVNVATRPNIHNINPGKSLFRTAGERTMDTDTIRYYSGIV